MKPLKIDNCAFGTLVIDGISHEDDLMILPDGTIITPWRRRRGHQLSVQDLEKLIHASPEVIIMGTGMSGGVKPDRDLETRLSRLGIKFMAAPNPEAVRTFNELFPKKRMGAGFHLTC
ncbi:MAG: Mth938-like domain-containing protein [Thermodesulfobacteriota bacterium]